MVKCLPLRYKSLHVIPRTHREGGKKGSLVTVVCADDPGSGEVETGLAWDSPANQPSLLLS